MNNSEPEALRADIAYILKVNELNEKVHKLPLPPPLRNRNAIFYELKIFAFFTKNICFMKNNDYICIEGLANAARQDN